MSPIHALVPAAGAGTRMQSHSPKQYLPLAGRPVLFHALRALLDHPAVGRVGVLLAPEDRGWFEHDWAPLDDRLDVWFCGGDSRARTVLNGLERLAAGSADWVLVHDSARPGLARAALDRLIRELQNDPVGGLLAVPLADTLKRADADLRVEVTVPRGRLWLAQTPQMFRHGLLLEALRAGLMADPARLTDEAGAVERLGHRPKLIKGDGMNFKVTLPADLELAARVLAAGGGR